MKFKLFIFVIVIIMLMSGCSLKEQKITPPTPVSQGENIEDNKKTEPQTTEPQTLKEEESTTTKPPEDVIDSSSSHWGAGVPLDDIKNSEEIDLTTISSTMVYAHIYNMMIAPDEYIGKTIKMTGEFVVYEEPESEKVYTSCLIVDALACCSQGLEFVLEGNPIYPEDYPEVNSQFTVSGIFEMYEDNGFSYVRLKDAHIM